MFPKRQKYDDSKSSTITSKYRVQFVRNEGPHKTLHTAIEVNDQYKPIGAQFQVRFINILSPSDVVKESPTITHPKYIIGKLKLPYRMITEWRFANDDDHNWAITNILDYRATILYEMRSQQIKGIEEYNSLIMKKRWLQELIDIFDIRIMDKNPWEIVEWEQKLQLLGVCRDSHSLFNLVYCDKIGIKLGLNPLEKIRIHQYCKCVLGNICTKTGSTMVLFDYYVREAVSTINKTEMNVKKKSNITDQQIRQLTLHYNNSFYVGRTNMHNNKFLISLRSIWDAQNAIIEKLYDMVYPFNTPYFAERTLLNLAFQIEFDVIHNIIGPRLWFNTKIHKCIESFANLYNLQSVDIIQRKAIHTYWNEAVSIVSGGPGRGKSSCVLKCMLYIAQSLYNIPIIDPTTKAYTFNPQIEDQSDEFVDDFLRSYTFVYVVSFTGKAVSRIKEILGSDSNYVSFEPMTIHRLLSKCKKDPFLQRQKTHIFIDEVSMVSDLLFYQLISCFDKLQKIVLLGDYDQLPSIQPGNLLKELIESRCLCVTRLIVNYRQGLGSQLPQIADKIIGRETTGSNFKRIWGGWNHALNISIPKEKSSFVLDNNSQNDCVFSTYSSNTNETTIFDAIKEKILQLRNNVNLFNDCIVLAAKRIDVAKLNAYLQSAFLPDNNDDNQKKITHKYEDIEFAFQYNDRIMYLENDYDQDLFNGDIGKIIEIDHRARTLEIDVQGSMKEARIDEIQPAYTLTTHKSQGSEYKYVIIYIGQDADLLHNDQWLYTAFTRAKQHVSVFGYKSEIEATMKREMPPRRTYLKHRLQLRFSIRLKDLLKYELQNVPL